MRRYDLVQLTTLADGASAPNLPVYVVLATRGGYALVKRPEVDGTAATATTICDLLDGASDVTATALGAAARTTIRTFLVNRGFDPADWDADPPTNRRLLLRMVLRMLNALELDGVTAVRGFDVS